ncbi:hypothetical protein UFOVP673_14 [uncultured Caudovirales phage]|uniref:Barnase-EndoU-ColicinE5/D-RelE like domain-containing protein n=1 Tax=uncultured Caudovirales phage TaxID=2100421 RepID=A0A6J5NJT1_9CAUD|nr:hypothetical protein UFOVP673_14 [uncultured Caudovirales phage]
MPLTRPTTPEEAEERLKSAFVLDDFGDVGGEVEDFPIPDKKSFLKTSATSAWAQGVIGSPVSPYQVGWQGQKDGIVRSYFNEKDASGVSDDDLFSKIAEDYKAKDALAEAARNAAARGESWLGKFREVEQTMPTVAGGRQSSYLGLAREVHDKFREKILPYQGIIKSVAEKARSIETSPEGMDWSGMAQELIQVPKESRPFVLEAISRQATANIDANAASRLGKEFARGFERFLDTAMSGSYNVLAAAGQYSEIPLAPETPQEIEARKARESQDADLMDLRDDIRDISTGKLAKLEDVRLLGMNISGAARNVPMTIGAFVPYIGPAALVGSFQRETANELRRANPTMSRETIEGIATISAPFQALTEVVSDRLLFGKLPNLKRLFTTPAFSAGGIAAQLAGRVALGTATEYAEEFTQGAVPKIVQSLSSDVPDVDWDGYFQDFKDQSPELLATIIPLALFGAGVGQATDYRASVQMLYSADEMMAAKIPEAEARKISELATTGKRPEAESLFRQEFRKAATKGEAPAEMRAAAQRVIAANQAQKQTFDDSLGDPSKFGVNMYRDAEGWKVETYNGSIIKMESAEAAARYVHDLKLSFEEYQAETVIALADDLVKAFPGTRLEFSPSQLSADKENGLVLFNPVTGQKTVLKDAKALENLWKEASAISFDSGNAPQYVLGQNFMEFSQSIARVFRDVSGRVNSVPQAITAMHEVIEAAWKKGLVDGAWSVEGTRQIIATLVPTLEAGIAKLGKKAQAQELLWLENAKKAAAEGNEDLIREVFSEMAVRTWIGRDRDGNKTGLRPGTILRALDAAVLQEKSPENVTTYQRLRAWFKAVGAYLKGVVATAKIIRDAERNGTIDDFTGFLDKVLGLETATREENEVKDGVIDMAFSLAPEMQSRAKPQTIAPVTEMPDGAQLVGPSTFSIQAYHGTPHKVDKFSTAKIGTGEGAQAYGWGLYFAENREVGEGYREKLAQWSLLTKDGKIYDDRKELKNLNVRAALNKNGSIDEAIARARSVIESIPGTQGAELASADIGTLEKLKADGGLTKTKGNLYTVELLPDADEFLDWDKPLSEQSEKVKAALSKEFKKLVQWEMTAGEWHSWMTNPRDGETDVKSFSEDAAKAGIPGIRYLDGGSRGAGDGTRNYVIFDESLVRILEENGKPVGSTFSLAPTEQDKNLVTVHNLTENNLKHALKVGGLAVPSLGVVRTDISSFDAFGEITLIARPDLVDPQRNKASKVFNADAYSPRYPTVKTVFNRRELDKVGPLFKGYFDELEKVTKKSYSWSVGNLVQVLEDEGFNRLQSNHLAQYAYLRDAGLIQPPASEVSDYEFGDLLRKQTNDLRDEIVSFVQSRVDGAGVKYDEKIPDGYTNSGKRKFLPHDLDTVVKIMTRKLKDGEGFNYGVPSIRAANAKPFKTLKAIQDSRNKIVTAEEMEALKKEVNEEFIKLAGSALAARKTKPSFGGLDAVSDDMKALVQGDNSWIREMYDDSSIIQEMKTFVAKLRDMPTEYFEAKVKRAVQLQEFEVAVVPSTASDELKALIRKKGVAVREYDPTDKTSRRTTIESASAEFGATFSLSPQSGIDIVSDTLESWQDVFDKAAKRNPARAMAIRDLAQQRINRLGEMWASDRWTAKGDKIRAVVEKRTKASLDTEQSFRETLELDAILAEKGMTTEEAQRSKDSKDYEAWQRFQESKALILSKGEFTEEEANKMAEFSSDAWRKSFVSTVRDAVKEAKARVAPWREEADDMQADDWSPRESLVRDMRVLNVALSAFPPEVRAKVTGGSMVKLAGLATERARYKAIQKALEKAIVETEVFMRKEYTGMLIKTLDKAAPIGKPGEVKKSKFIVTVQDEIDAINDMVGMDHDDVATAIAAAEAAIITAQTPEDADAKLTELNLLELFGGILDIKNTSSQEMASALEYLENIISQGRDARKIIDEARRERVKEMVNNAKREAYKGDSGPETTQAARATSAKKSGKAMLKKFFNELSGFDAVLRDAFGPKSKTATEFSERFTLNSNRFEDVQNERRKRFRDFARELYRTKLGAKINQKLITLERIENASGVTYLKNRTVKTHKFTEEEAARIVADPKAFGFTEKDAVAISEEIQAIQETGGRRKVFTYEQVENEGDRTEIPLSQMDALYLSMALRQPGILEQQQRYGYDQETVDQLEKFLTDDAKRWRSWMQTEYDSGYNSSNEVYMRINNTRMPKITFYAPLLKNHQGQQAVLDPLNTGISSNSANPGSIKTRKARTSSLRIESAFSVFWSHFNQMEYWNANAEYLRDVQSVMLNPEVREAVVSAHGEDGMATISAWVQLQMSRGVGKAAMALASNKMIRNIKSGISMKALALSYTTTLKTLPSVFYSLGEIHMSKWPAALVSGMKHWDRLWKTNIIQRRLDIGGMPELRDLGSSALPMSWVNQGIRYGSYPTMYADGVFTTYSAAMAYGTSFDEAKRQGASDDMAHKYAEERTSLIVSKTAQPENWTQKSLFENDASGAGVLWTMFMSDPRQKMALTGEVLNQWRKGTATREEAARKFLAYWVIPGVMFQLANAVGRSLFKGDDDEWEFVDFATAALVGQFQGLVLFGSAIEMIFSAAIAAAAEKITGEEVKRKPVWNSSKNPLDQAAQDLIKSGEKLFMEDGDPLEKSWEAAKSAGMAITPLYPAGAILSTGERVMKDTTNLFYGADEK